LQRGIKGVCRRALHLLPALLLFAVLAPAAAWARHDPWLIETGDPNDSHCGFCHTLDTNNGAPTAEPGTSYINPSARTILPMKAANGGTAPATFGCTFCHSNKLTNVRMQDALSSFDDRLNRHPVGRDFSGTITDKIYLTTIGTDMTNELDCVDCHDATLLTYPDHQTVANGGSWDQDANPGGLLNVSAAGFASWSQLPPLAAVWWSG
jgi:hypothetical protein